MKKAELVVAFAAVSGALSCMQMVHFHFTKAPQPDTRTYYEVLAEQNVQYCFSAQQYDKFKSKIKGDK